MIYYNKNSKRINPFQKVYDSPIVRKIPNEPPKFPIYVDIEPTNFCNLQCRMCPRIRAKRKIGFMTYDVFRKVVRECKKNQCPIRLIGWGEPFTHPKMQDFIEYVKQSSSQLLHITTNGLAFKKYDMECMVGHGVDSLIFSFQGVNEYVYNFMRNTNEYDRLNDQIRTFLEVRADNPKPFVQVTTTITNESQEQIDKFVNYWLPKVDAVSVGRTNLAIMPGLNLKKGSILKHVPCTEVYHQIQVDWDGNVSPCCGDYDNYLTIGNVNNQSIKHIWNKSKRLQEIRKKLLNKGHSFCKLCEDCYPTYEGID